MHKIRTAILLALGATAIASSVVAMLMGNQEWDGLLLNLGTEMAGAVLTYGLFKLFIGRRERQEEEKARLIAQMGSDVRDVAVPAVDELRRRGWLIDGSVQGAVLIAADLTKAFLSDANLLGANLNSAALHGANLSKANLFGADLRSADLSEADLRGADLFGANLSEVHLDGADLCRANLGDAEVSDEQLAQAKSLEGALMPDGTIARLVRLRKQ